MNSKIKMIGKHTLKYIVFLVAVMAWMIVLGPKDTLTANEKLDVQQFMAELESEPKEDTQLVSEVTPTQIASDPSVSSNIKYGIINENSVNVRTGPGLDYPIARQLFQGNEVELVEEMDGGWWKISLDESFFYVKNDFVNVQTLSSFNQ